MLDDVPKRVFTLEEAKPDEEIYEMCITLKDVPGALAKAAKVLADANVNVKMGSSFYAPGHPGVGFWSSFIDVSKATRSTLQLEEELRRLDVVVDVRLEECKPVPFEIIHFPVLHANTRAAILPIGTLFSLWDGLERILGPSGLAVVHYHAGMRTGEHTAKRLKEMYGVEDMDLILAFAQAERATGWGIMEFQDIDFKRCSGTVIVKECFEAAAWRRKPDKACHWTRGILAGFMSSVFNKPVESVEVKCLATGDEHCEFKIRERI